ncbi:MAG: deoxyribose-phosphate aldolase [Bacteroidales bacterium]|nr:deoxyribose-phosphate aldolase [Bacteroidales bacterium]
MMDFLSNYNYPYSILGLAAKIEELNEISAQQLNEKVLTNIFGLIDLTTLNSTDTKAKVHNMCLKVNDIQKEYPFLPNVAAICVYPSLVETVKSSLNAKGVGIASVAAGFPSSQTFLNIKTLESKQAVEKGATDIDIVISIGAFLSGNYQLVFDEIAEIKDAIGNAHLKVILETGALSDPLKIWEASIIAMNAGADFIKTSTGKMQPAATFDAAVVMVEAIRQHYKITGKKVGFKPAGGISSSRDAVEYYTIVASILGQEWLNSKLFRIGASSLANNLISDIIKLRTGELPVSSYF